jgi:hypothetical protein
MSSAGDNLSAKNVNTENIRIHGIIDWTGADFYPPLGGGGPGGDTPTLAAVLEAGNDANNEEILNVGKITLSANGNNVNQDASISGASSVACQSITTTFATALEVTVGDDLALGTAQASGGTITFNAQAGQGACSITGPSAQNRCVVTNCDFTSTSNAFPPSIDDDTLDDVLQRGNDANNQSITGVNQITAAQVSATVGDFTNAGVTALLSAPVISSRALTINATGAVGQTQGIINLNVGASTASAEIDFTGFGAATETDTFIKGHDGTYKTVCTNLDLSDPTNVLPPDAERFEWGAHIFPSNLHGVESDDEDWKYFGDDFGPQFTDNECYAITAPTTNPSHARQIIKVTFNVVEYGWGNILIGLDKANLNGTSPVGLTGKAFSTKVDGKGIQTADRQKIGQCTMYFYVEGMPTDGTQIRIYPKVKTNFDDQGRVSIKFGPGIDHDGPTAGISAPVIIQGFPVPPQWRNYTGS